MRTIVQWRDWRVLANVFRTVAVGVEPTRLAKTTHMSKTPRLNRRRFCGVAVATVAAGPLDLLRLSKRVDAMTDVMPEVAEETGSAENDIRPYHVSFSDAELTDLRRRVKATRWPEKETVSDQTNVHVRSADDDARVRGQGVGLATMQKLASYWAGDYDWHKVETRLNAVPNFITNIDGLDIHFIHVKSKEKNALPLIITHGWPGSVIEQLKIIAPLTDPTAHGGKAEDAFDVVIPSLPGYGFSGKPTTPGWDPPRIARAWTTLMKRLGYTRFAAQGGDWGGAIVDQMGLQAPPELLAISTNMAATVPADIAKALAAGGPPPTTLTADERNAWDQLAFFYKYGLGYANEMALRPQTLYAIADSPIGLAAWMLDHDARSYGMLARSIDGKPEGVTPTDILDNITLYWLTNTAVSSARLYWENRLTAKGGFFDAKGVKIPVAVTVFPDEISAAPRSWAERAYPKMIYFKKFDKGTHFAAWEQPAYIVEGLREGLKSLRK